RKCGSRWIDGSKYAVLQQETVLRGGCFVEADNLLVSVDPKRLSSRCTRHINRCERAVAEQESMTVGIFILANHLTRRIDPVDLRVGCARIIDRRENKAGSARHSWRQDESGCTQCQQDGAGEQNSSSIHVSSPRLRVAISTSYICNRRISEKRTSFCKVFLA